MKADRETEPEVPVFLCRPATVGLVRIVQLTAPVELQDTFTSLTEQVFTDSVFSAVVVFDL